MLRSRWAHPVFPVFFDGRALAPLLYRSYGMTNTTNRVWVKQGDKHVAVAVGSWVYSTTSEIKGRVEYITADGWCGVREGKRLDEELASRLVVVG